MRTRLWTGLDTAWPTRAIHHSRVARSYQSCPEPRQLMRLTHNAATARPCRVARGTMIRSQSSWRSRALAGVSWLSAAAVRGG